MLEGSGTGVPTDDAPLDEELIDFVTPEPFDVLPGDVLQATYDPTLWEYHGASAGTTAITVIAAVAVNMANLISLIACPWGLAENQKCLK